MILPRRKLSATVPAMAMGDIAFLLLIFFVILARVRDDSHIQWEPARIDELEQAKNSKASVAIGSDNETYLNGRKVEDIGSLAGDISEILGESKAGNRTVLFKVDKHTKAKDFEPVIEAISDAGGDLLHVLEDVRMKN